VFDAAPAITDTITQAKQDAIVNTEQRLREDGSRTITHADGVETKAKVVGATTVVGMILQTFNSLYQDLSPLLPLIGGAMLATLGIGLSIYMYIDAKKIKAARVDDQVNGAHIGRPV
jgi:hypothetical protein